VGVFFLLRYFNKRVRPIYTRARERLGDVSNRLQENFSGVVVIKIFNREKQEAQRFRRATEAYYDAEIAGSMLATCSSRSRTSSAFSATSS